MPHDFFSDNFLEERLKQSEQLLDLILADLEQWSRESSIVMSFGEKELRGDFLRDTSWSDKHSNSQGYTLVNSLTKLLSGVEVALKHRAIQNDTWWQKNEPNLRTTRDTSIRYFIIQAYKENIEVNIAGIEFQLQDRALICERELHYELGELMKMSYPYISASAQANNQTTILSLYVNPKNNPDNSIWKYREAYNLLISIPSVFRSQESQNFIDNWQEYFAHTQLKPEIYSWGGVVRPPLTSEELLKLSDKSLFRLFSYYQQFPNQDSFDYDMKGGFREVVAVLREASSINPERFLGLLSSFIATNLHQSYLHAAIEGIANYLRQRFDALSSGEDRKPIDPLADEKVLATTLMKLLEQYSVIWNNKETVRQALESCCSTLDDPESAERLTLLLFWAKYKMADCTYSSVLDHEIELVPSTHSSIRKSIAKSAIMLCNKLLENNHTLPELLPYLLHHFAHDSDIFVRIPILENLPFLMYKQPTLGWQLLSDVFQEPQTHLWKYAEWCFYYQYQHNFQQVTLYLARLFHEGMEEAGDVWGRISTLASLTGHISKQALFDTLRTANHDAWKGAARVFVANLNQREHMATCHSGLITILGYDNLSSEVIREIQTCFGKEANRGIIQHELALSFLNALSVSSTELDIHDFLEWLSYEAHRNPLFTLNVAEMLAETLETKMQLYQISDTQPLISVLYKIFCEADEIDDPELIQRAINLQDRFLRLNIDGIEELFTKAGQH